MDAVIDREGWTDDVDLVQTLVRRAVCCPCPHPTRIAIVYERGTESERWGHELLELLHVSRHDILVHLQPDDDPGPQARSHSCVVVDALNGTMS